MIVKLFLVNAFADGLFSGGRAGVAILRHLGQEAYLQGLADEIALPLMVYVLPGQDEFMARYFTPKSEIESTAVGALAAAHVIYGAGLAPPDQPVLIHGRGGGGPRKVYRTPGVNDGGLSLLIDYRTVEPAVPEETAGRLAESLGLTRSDIAFTAMAGPNHLTAGLRDQMKLKNIVSSLAVAAIAPFRRLALSAPLASADGYAVRCFSTRSEREEMPVDFDLHGVLAGRWAQDLGRSRLEIHHLASRACRLWAEPSADGTVTVSGQMSTVLKADPTLIELTGEQPGGEMFF